MTISTEQWKAVRRRHYLLNPENGDFWVKLSWWRLSGLASAHGDDFCVILNASRAVDDVYILPYPLLRPLLFYRGRPDGTHHWHVTIRDGILRVEGAPERLNVRPFHNYSDLLHLYALKPHVTAA